MGKRSSLGSGQAPLEAAQGDYAGSDPRFQGIRTWNVHFPILDHGQFDETELSIVMLANLAYPGIARIAGAVAEVLFGAEGDSKGASTCLRMALEMDPAISRPLPMIERLEGRVA